MINTIVVPNQIGTKSQAADRTERAPCDVFAEIHDERHVVLEASHPSDAKKEEKREKKRKRAEMLDRLSSNRLGRKGRLSCESCIYLQ